MFIPHLVWKTQKHQCCGLRSLENEDFKTRGNKQALTGLRTEIPKAK